MKVSTKQIIIGTALIVLPGSSLVLGGYLLYKGIKRAQLKKNTTFRSILEEMVVELNKKEKTWKSS